MIFQNPSSHLDPLMTIGRQVAEPLIYHRGMGAREARSEAIDLLRQVGIPDPKHNIDAYPHQFSGGMRQRAVIAGAIACRPDLLVADEPTTALEVIVSRLGPGAVLIDAIGESPLLLLASAPPLRLGRWLNDAVVVLFGKGDAIVAAGSELLELAPPRLLVLASDETSVDRAIADLRGRLEGTALVALEPALALEV